MHWSRFASSSWRAGDWGYDVGGVEPAAQPDFDHRDLDARAPKHLEGHGRGGFEEGRRDRQPTLLPQPFGQRQHVVRHGVQRRGVDLLAADDEALGQVAQVRRDIARRTHARRQQRRMRHRRHRALAVRPRDVQRLEAAFGMPERFAEALDVLETKLDPEGLEGEESI